jgi:hypothetical protein
VFSSVAIDKPRHIRVVQTRFPCSHNNEEIRGGPPVLEIDAQTFYILCSVILVLVVFGLVGQLADAIPSPKDRTDPR